MALLLSGAPVRQRIKEDLIKRVETLGRAPVLAIVTVGERADTSIYLKNKEKFGAEIGVRVVIKKFSDDITEEQLAEEVTLLGSDTAVDAIIVQLPLPPHIHSEHIVSLVPASKDADGLSGSIDTTGSNIITPATARGVSVLLDFYDISIKDKKVVVVGRSKLAGGPIAETLSSQGALVTVCHSGTDPRELPQICQSADILVSATGTIGLITKDFVHSEQVVIDVGINRVNADTKKIVGDVAFDEVEPIVYAITPVPGGVGLLTVASLFENVLDLCYTTPVI